MFIQCCVYMNAAYTAQSKAVQCKTASFHCCCSLPPPWKITENILDCLLNWWFVSCFQYHSAFIFTLFTNTRKIYAGNITNNDVLFSRSQMHNYIKKKKNLKTQHLVIVLRRRLCVCLCVCVWGLGWKNVNVCVDKLCCACRTYRGERWIEWERWKRGFVLQVSVDTDEWTNK